MPLRRTRRTSAADVAKIAPRAEFGGSVKRMPVTATEVVVKLRRPPLRKLSRQDVNAFRFRASY
jgi:hypothetical protein